MYNNKHLKGEIYMIPSYFEDFINAMHKHTKDYDNELEEEMQRKFQNAILKQKSIEG